MCFCREATALRSCQMSVSICGRATVHVRRRKVNMQADVLQRALNNQGVDRHDLTAALAMLCQQAHSITQGRMGPPFTNHAH